MLERVLQPLSMKSSHHGNRALTGSTDRHLSPSFRGQLLSCRNIPLVVLNSLSAVGRSPYLDICTKYIFLSWRDWANYFKFKAVKVIPYREALELRETKEIEELPTQWIEVDKNKFLCSAAMTQKERDAIKAKMKW